jgi:death-on-curing protein
LTDWRWIERGVVEAIHERQIEEHGGHAGIRDAGLLESALARPRMLLAYGDPDLFDLAAAYGWGIACNHAFVDGNKRTAYVVCRLFLELHGAQLTAPPTDRVIMFERVGAGLVSQQELSAWLRVHGSVG